MTEVSLATDQLKASITEFLDDYSIEITPHDKARIDEIAAELRPGTRVYIAHPPGMPIEEVTALAAQIQGLGFSAVPHLIARKLSSRDQLERALAALSQAGVDQALVVGGDIAVDDVAFDSSLEVLQTGLLGDYGFREVGVAGHPEGSDAIGEARVKQALAGKGEFAESAPFALRLVTQFGFDAQAFIDWERATGAAGVKMPIHVGLAGPASLRQLIKFAMLCGVGASARMLKTRTAATTNLLRTQAPDNLITHFASHRICQPSTRIVSAHFFAFGGVVKCARWANAARSGNFELNAGTTGFSVSKAS